MTKSKAPKKRVRKTAGKQGKGLLSAFKKVLGTVKQISDATGIKPSTFVASKNPAIGALLASQGLGKKPRKRGPRRAGKTGGNFFDSLFSPATALLGAVGNTVGNTVGSVLGGSALGGSATKAGRVTGSGRRVTGSGRRVTGGCAIGYPNASTASASVVKF